MALKFDNQTVSQVNYNGSPVYQLKKDDSVMWCRPYTITITKDTGVATVSVRRTSTQEPSASTGGVTTGATIFYGDKLSVTALPSSGYTVDPFTRSYTVGSNISINITAKKSYAYSAPDLDECYVEEQDNYDLVYVRVNNLNNATLKCKVEIYIGFDNNVIDQTYSPTIAANGYWHMYFGGSDDGYVTSSTIMARFVDANNNPLSDWAQWDW